jgi:hypothetical protein
MDDLNCIPWLRRSSLDMPHLILAELVAAIKVDVYFD